MVSPDLLLALAKALGSMIVGGVLGLAIYGAACLLFPIRLDRPDPEE